MSPAFSKTAVLEGSRRTSASKSYALLTKTQPFKMGCLTRLVRALPIKKRKHRMYDMVFIAYHLQMLRLELELNRDRDHRKQKL
jgi:hypothetical protein